MINKFVFQLNADHSRMCVVSYARVTLTLTPWPWHSTLTWRCSCISEINFVGKGIQKLRARTRQTQTHRRDRTHYNARWRVVIRHWLQLSSLYTHRRDVMPGTDDARRHSPWRGLWTRYRTGYKTWVARRLVCIVGKCGLGLRTIDSQLALNASLSSHLWTPYVLTVVMLTVTFVNPRHSTCLIYAINVKKVHHKN